MSPYLSILFRKHHVLFAIAIGLFCLALTFIVYKKQSAPDFSSYPAGLERKSTFLNYLYPLIEENNAVIAEQRETILVLKQKAINNELSWWHQLQVKDLATRYDIDDFDSNSQNAWKELLMRVNTIPPAMALAQAAKESGWGTSRFAANGNNFFGQWCFKQGCGLIPKARKASSSHEVAVFNSAKESVQAYMHNINTHQAYSELRSIRAKLHKTGKPFSGLDLIQGLNAYSERGIIYVKELSSLIKFNQLENFGG
jgi:Bax protein